VREHPAAPPAEAQRHFLARLAVETDPSDLVHDLTAGTGGIVVIDTRSPEDFARCHIPGARSLPHRRISAETTADIDRDAMLVTYCWGPACNAATRAAAKLAALGFSVKELIGGLEYWRLEGCPVEGSEGSEAPLYWQHRR
jgi:rhodanese-related sulfurtransferase